MINIRIKKTGKSFSVTVDEFPEITVTAKTYEQAKEGAVRLTKEEIAKTLPETIEEEKPTKIGFGFAA